MGVRLGVRAKFYSTILLLLILLLVFETKNDRESLRRHFLSGAQHNAREMALEATGAGTVIVGSPEGFRRVAHPLLTGSKGHEEVSPSSAAFQIRLLPVRGEVPAEMKSQFERLVRGEEAAAYDVNEEGIEKWLRYMLPVQAEERCLSCHGELAMLPRFLKGSPSADAARLAGFRSGETMAVITVRVSLDEMEREFQENFESTLLFSGGFEIIIMIALAFLTHRLVLLPVRRLTESVRQTELTGRFEAVPVTSEDEIGALTRAYNDMMEEVSRLLVQRHDSAERHAAVIEMVPMPIVTFTADGKIVLFNQVAAAVFSLDRQTSLGDDFFGLFADPRQVRTAITSVIGTGQGGTSDVTARLTDGRQILMHVMVSSVADAPLFTVVGANESARPSRPA